VMIWLVRHCLWTYRCRASVSVPQLRALPPGCPPSTELGMGYILTVVC
jgi:hypothetical protein